MSKQKLVQSCSKGHPVNYLSLFQQPKQVSLETELLLTDVVLHSPTWGFLKDKQLTCHSPSLYYLVLLVYIFWGVKGVVLGKKG